MQEEPQRALTRFGPRPSCGGYASLARPMVHAAAHETVRIGHLRLRMPGSRRVRASVLAGTVRVRAVMEAVLYPGATVIDVGANIGYLTALAAVRVGRGGRVIAVEPADDNLAVLRENVWVNGLDQVRVVLEVVRIGDLSARGLSARDLPSLPDRLSVKGRPVELYARRSR